MGRAAKHAGYQIELSDGRDDHTMGLAAEASVGAAEATTRALAAAARAKEAEEMAGRQTCRIAASEAELAELRRKLSEMQSNFGSPWVNIPRQ